MNIIQEGGGGNGGDGNDQSQPQPQPQPAPAQRCPRCDSVNTKFCYYNNYSLSQPRYFCKTCKRYWTQGGSLRNIPIGGGGCRMGKRSKTTSFASSSSSSSAIQQLMTRQSSQPNPTASPAPRGLIGPAVGPYYQGGGYLSSHHQAAMMIHSQNQLSQPLFNLSSLNMATTPSSSSNIHHPWFNASSSSSRSHIPPPPMPSPLFESDESVHVSDDNQQGGVVQTSMNMNMMIGNSGYASSLNDWSQNNSLWSTVSTTSIGGDNTSGSPSNNDDRSDDINGNNKAGGSSSSLSGNPWPRLP